MLTIYRRHVSACPHTSRNYKQCKCPLWVQGTLAGANVRQSLNLTSWETGQRIVRDWEANGRIGQIKGSVPTIPEAIAKFLEDGTARGLSAASMGKYALLLERRLVPWAASEGYRLLRQLDVSECRDFRASWPDAPLSASKKLERLRTFFKFCMESGWLDTNPAKRLAMPKVPRTPTLPFTAEEMDAIMRACETYPIKGIYGKRNRQRITAFVLVLRYTGLRIGDVVTLARSAVQDGGIFLYTQKTGTHVRVPVPPFVLNALAAVPHVGMRFFWSGRGKLKSCVTDWQRTLQRMFELAGVAGGHAHRFRDTFAVELLLAGVAIEDVAILLGHSSKDITEKHYAPWVAARQARLESAVQKTWPVHGRLRVVTGGA
jgi:integrase